MELKAKLEAVIYAAEEPVTLAQLATLFAADALEWKAQQQTLPADAAGEDAADPVLTEEMVFAEQTVETAEEAGSVPDAGTESEPGAEQETSAEQSESGSESDSAPADAPDAEPESDAAPGTEEEAAPGADSSAAAEAEARRAARLRDREIRDVIRQLLAELIAEYAADARGIEIREIAGGYRMATKPSCHDAVRQFVKSLKPALKLSLPALETLAVIAYKQPVTAPEVNEIRGVDSSAVFGSLLARKLIATAGRKPVIGRPILYKTTREFLLRFGLKDVTELPSMEEFEKIAALELDEPEFAPAGASDEPENKGDTDPRLEFDQNNGEPLNGASKEAAPAVPFPTEQAEIESLHHGTQTEEE